MELMQVLDDIEDCDRNDPIEDKTRIPRPANAFMIFGQQFRKKLAQKFKDLSNKEISKVLGDEWRKMDRQTKNHFHQLADETHKKHLQKYPGYYYSPLEARQRKAERKRKPKVSKTKSVHNNSGNNRQMDNCFVWNFNEHNTRPFMFRNPMYPMVRPPMLCPPMHLRMPFTQPFGGFRQNYSFGGPVTPVPLDSYALPQTYPMIEELKSGQTSEYSESTESQLTYIQLK